MKFGIQNSESLVPATLPPGSRSLEFQNQRQKEAPRVAGDDAGTGVTLGAAGEVTFIENIIARSF